MEQEDKRIDKIIEILVEYLQNDFSHPVPISEKGDKIDVIAVGLNTLREELENRILQLKEKSEQLEIINKELESFSYSVAHDLRAPLRAITGFTQVLEKEYKDKIDDEGKRLMGLVTDNAKKMGQLIDDLLGFSRLGKKEIQKTSIDTKAMLSSMLKELDQAQWIGKATIVVKDLLSAYGDSTLIHQVFYNLATNALKYSRTKMDPIIEVGSYSEGDENIYYVRDNGVGFDMKYYDKLFKVFQRLHNPEEFEGTGIGLAIVHKIVLKHGGRVWAEGKVNEGSTFYFSLPKP